MPRYSIDISISPLLDRLLVAPLLFWRRIWHGYSFRKIRLTNSQLYAIIDQADFHTLSKYDWFIAERGQYKKAIRIDKQKGPTAIINMHRQILNAPKGMLVDHIDNNTLNNTRSNLRLATRQQNQMNKRPRNNSRYKGINKSSKSKAWESRICYNNKKLHIGYFDTDAEAARAYDEAAKKYFGEFAYLNFPPEQKPKGLKNIIKHIFKNI